MKYLIISLSFFAISSVSNAQMGLGTTSPAVKLHIKSNAAMLRLEGTDHALMEFYPKGAATRYGYLGVPNSSSNDIFLYNQYATGALEFGTNNLKRMQIASDGKVGIGSITPATMLHIENGNSIGGGSPASNIVPSIYLYNNNASSNTAHSMMLIRTNDEFSGNPFLSMDIANRNGYSMGIDNADADKFKFFSNWNFNTGASPAMTMTLSNYVGIGTSSPGHKLEISSSDATSLKITSSTNDNDGMVVLNANTGNNWSSDWHEFMVFQKQGVTIGAIKSYNSGAGVSYATTSDYRLKTDFKNFKGLELINKLKVYDYAWKANDSRMYGFKAHEIQEVIPYMTNGEKDAVDSKGNPIYQMVDYSKLTPVLAKAIQEQQEVILNQQQRIERLEKMVEELLNRK